jgi:predicted nucleotidyltransferase
LADWAVSAPTATIYLYGSRVRGDHRTDSDVDISVRWVGAIEEVNWWKQNNDDDFANINAELPGKLHVLPENDPVTLKIRLGKVVHTDRNVRCISLPRTKQSVLTAL